MIELVEANWWLFVIALLIGIAVAWWIFVANRKTRVERAPKQDVLDEGAERAKRNESLIAKPVAADFANAADLATAGTAPSPELVEPAPAPAPAPAPTAGDDLTRIKGIGPKLQTLLNSLGVTSYAEIAGWSEADVDRIDAQLGTFEGRIRRDSWIEQAKFLSTGDTAGYEGKFGKL